MYPFAGSLTVSTIPGKLVDMINRLGDSAEHRRPLGRITFVRQFPLSLRADYLHEDEDGASELHLSEEETTPGAGNVRAACLYPHQAANF